MLRIHSFSRDLLISVCSFLLFSGIARGQILNVTNATSTPIPGAGHDYIKMLSETVNPANGSVSIRIQVPVPPGRGITLPFAFAYDSSGFLHPESFWVLGVTFLSNTGYLAQGGWSFSIPVVSSASDQRSKVAAGKPPQPTYTCPFSSDFVFHDPSGGLHALGLAELNSYECARYFGFSNKTSGGDDIVRANLTIPGGLLLVADADGTVYHFPSPWVYSSCEGVGCTSEGLPDFIEDRNGNRITITDAGGGAVTVNDTAGRAAVSISGFGGSSNTVGVSGVGNYTVTWGTASYNYNVGAVLWPGDSNCSTPSSVAGTSPVVRSIELPNGQSFEFYYDSDNPSYYDTPGDGPYGLLSEIRYPTGGYVRYVWAINSNSEAAGFTDANGIAGGCKETYGMPAVYQRFGSFDGSSEVLEQQFQYGTSWNSTYTAWNQKTTAVTTYARGQQFSTDYYYSPITQAIPPYEVSYTSIQVPVEQQVLYTDWSGSLLRTENKSWADQYKMLCDSRTEAGSTARIDYAYSTHGAQVTDKMEWDWGMQAACPASGYTPPTGTPLRETKTQYWVPPNNTLTYPAGQSIFDRPSSVAIYGGGSQAAQTSYGYDGSSPSPAGITVGRDTSYNGNTSVARGNLTSKTEWVNTTGTPLPWSYTNDDTGQRLSATDINNGTTNYSYTDGWSSVCDSPPAPGSTNAYLTEILDAKQFTQTFTYRYCDGQLASATDRNTQTTGYAYNDSLGRLTQTTDPDGGTITNKYNDGSPTSTIVTSRTMDSSGTTNTTTRVFDGAGHVTQTQLNTDPDCSGSDNTDTTYDGLGSVWTVSNPYCSSAPDPRSTGTTTYTYDALGRLSDENGKYSIAYPDGSATSTKISGNTTTIKDPAGAARALTYDGLGRLQKVVEGPGGLGYATNYTYSALDDLITVGQGSQTRTFVYDSLSRLTSATNPESGTTTYTYSTPSSICSGDPSSVCTRTDARGISTTYTYNDPLNRLTSKTYSDGTPTANFFYDAAPGTMPAWSGVSFSNAKGRLALTCTGSAAGTCTSPQAATVHSYDPMGRTSYYCQCTPYNCASSSIWSSSYQYKYTGEVSQWTHPAGYTFTNTVSPARRITQIQSSQVDTSHPQYPAQSINYTPWGAVSALQNPCVGSGCTLQETYFYNNRMQMAVVELGTSATHAADSCRVYNYYVGKNNVSACSETPSNWPTGTNNNGNVAGYFYQDSMNALGHTATYTYDGVNRLKTAVATGNVGYSQSFTYDQYGNMSCAASPAENKCLAPTYSPTTNQISGYQYDSAGDLTNDGTYGYQWDAEGRLTAITLSGNPAATNVYNALGQNARHVGSGETTDEAYGPDGSLLWRHTGGDSYTRAFVPFQGRILAEYYGGSPPGLIFDHPDEIGSLTIGIDYATSHSAERLFYPFGEPWTGSDLYTLGMHQEFAQLPDYDNDANSDLYNTLSRHYTPMGRWLSPDPGPWIFLNPQSYNAYAYVLNSPLGYSDDGGETAQDRVNAAYAFAGQNIPYSWGGKEPACGLDCSGLVQNAFVADPDNPIAALNMAQNAASQASVLQQAGEYSTDINNAEPGDVVFFSDSYGHIVHTGIVVDIRDGRVYFVHAPHPGPRQHVRVASFSMKALQFGRNGRMERFAGFGRPFEPSSNHLVPNPIQSYSTNGGGLWELLVELFFNWTPPTAPREEVTSRFVCGVQGTPPCE
jgi:RHS repeat-associated protein